jgi:hypothetical protein
MTETVNGIEIDVNASTVDQVANAILDMAAQPIESLSKMSEEQLKLAAKKFLDVVDYEQKNIKQLQDVLDAKKKWENAFNKNSGLKGDALSSARHQEEEYIKFNQQIKNLKKEASMQQSIQNIYKAGLGFQDLINKAIGQDPVIILQSVNKKDIQSFEVPLKEAFSKKILYIDISSDGKVTMRFRAPMTRLMQYANDVDSEIKKIDNGDSEDKKNLDKAYREVLRRFNKYKLQIPKNKVVSVVLWKKQSEWMKMLPSSRGDIAEGYEEYYLLNAHQTMTGSLEDDIDLLMTYIANVDNARGRLMGDISKKNADGTSTEFAIKSAGASVEKLEQIIEMANAILYAPVGSTAKEILLEMKKFDDRAKVKRNKIEKLCKDELLYSVTKGIKTEINVFTKGFSLTE